MAFLINLIPPNDSGMFNINNYIVEWGKYDPNAIALQAIVVESAAMCRISIEL